jgi:hypothetical protein
MRDGEPGEMQLAKIWKGKCEAVKRGEMRFLLKFMCMNFSFLSFTNDGYYIYFILKL